MTIQQVFGLAMRHASGGRLSEAEGLYRQIIAVQPNHADALHMLGIIRRRAGDNQAAAELIWRALAVNPACIDAHYNLGNTLRDLGRGNEAADAYRLSIKVGQNLPQSYHNLGCVLRDQGLLEEADTAFTKEQEALRASRQVIAWVPAIALVWYHRGNSLAENRQYAQAIAAYRQAVTIYPDFAEAYCNLGNALIEENQPEAATAAYRTAISLRPDLAQAHHNLGKVFYDWGELDQAIAANRRAIALRRDYAAACRNLANCLFEAGNLDEAIATYRESRGNDDASNAKTDSDLIYTLHFHPDYNSRAIAEETSRWNERYAQPLANSIQPHTRDFTTDRRLRIGYVSLDFRHHVVGQNLVPLFREHDHQQFEIVCYCDVARPDGLTRWFEEQADTWRDTSTLSNEQLADVVRDDRIDILVDLALHTRENRLLAFARKPAPVQVTFAGYPGTTGLTAIDFRLSDPYLDPPGMDESVYSEQTLLLPHSFWCYDPSDCRDIAINPPPARESGIITFGCLNNFAKVNPFILNLWATVMARVAGSRLLLLAKQGSHRQRTVDHLSRLGIASDRIEFISYVPRRNYLQHYYRIDISLDTFPYNGHTTSLDSFWMGIPVITLVGQTAVSRAGWSQLSNLGMTELAAHTPEQFVQIAVDLANDLGRLEEMRRNLRRRLEQSSLCNAAGFARCVEAAYLQMWQISKNRKDVPG